MSRLVARAFKKAHPSPSNPDGGPGVGTETLITLQAALTILKDSVDGVPLPGLKASLAGLLSVITAIRVCYFVTVVAYCSNVVRTFKETEVTLRTSSESWIVYALASQNRLGKMLCRTAVPSPNRYLIESIP